MISTLRHFGLGLAATFFMAGAAQAATLASVVIGGDYSITSPTTNNASEMAVDGYFDAYVLPPVFPTGDAIYTFTGSIYLDSGSLSSPIFLEGSERAVLTPGEAGFAASVVADLISDLIFYEDTLLPLPGGVGTVIHDFQNVATTNSAAEIAAEGDFTLDVATNSPIGPLVDAALAGLLADLMIDIPGLSAFNFPNNDAGAFELILTVDVAPVPLPAGGLLLLTGLAGLAAARRKRG